MSDQPTTSRTTAPTRRRLGDILVDNGTITIEQLRMVLDRQQTTGARLGELLLDLGMVTPIELLRALADQFELEFVDLATADIDHDLVQRVPPALASRHRAVPIGWADGTAIVAMANPSDVVALDDIRSIVRAPVRPVMADSGQIGDLIATINQGNEQVRAAIRSAVADATEEAPEREVSAAAATVDDAPIVRFVELMIAKAVAERASDIHIEPSNSGLRVRYRIDGVLHEVMHPPKSLHSSMVSRIKVMAGIDIAEKRIPQDGRVSMNVAGRAIDLRVATVPTVYGEAVVMRILRRDDGLMKVADLGMERSQLARFQAACARTWGIVLVTGPTGSGKTTTLYSVLKDLNQPTRNIMTVEDPVEYRLEGIKQLQVNNRAGLTFANALRSMMRADPDVVLVGEIRDKETATIAVEASLTGHLVLASLHTNDAASTPARLIEMGVEPYLVVSGLRGVMAQRLARRLCERCRRLEPMPEELALAAGVPPSLVGGQGLFPRYVAVGCPACSNTGYRGRFAVNEFLEVSETIAQMILDRQPARVIERRAIDEGMLTLREAGFRHVASGQTTIEDLLRCVS